ncbi:ABC transporter substrate-binding protein [Neobacillus niacini]|uniref:ABC transporter substrate-binding protein n=1 Tax=Neobacillus niacini TaxID=86668 RepID=UPI0005F06EA2|nr:ABC transporter substrate-binding protein [Neobacillus niacini]
MRSYLKAFFLLNILTLFIIAGCSNSNNDTTGATVATSNLKTSDEKSITIGITNPPGAFNPIKRVDLTGWYVTSILYSPLVEMNSSFEFVPKLAKSIESEDNQIYTVKLQENAVWSDGKPVTAEDVFFTAKLIGSLDSGSLIQGVSMLEGFNDSGKLEDPNADITGVKLIDEFTVQFKTKTRVDENLFKQQLGAQFLTLPKHIYGDNAPSEFAKHPDVQEPKVTNGPFKFGKYAANQYIELVANESYFLGAPKLDKLFFKIMPAANIVAQLQSGEVDMNYPGIGSISSQDFERVENLTNVNTTYGDALDYQTLGFNLETIKDVRIRQAIAMGINREMIVESLLKGKGEINDLVYASSSPYFNKSIKPIEYDPEEAKKLLKEANWEQSKVLKFVVPSGNTTREQMADLIVQNLSEIGIKVEIEKYDLPTASEKARSGEFDILVLGFPFSFDPDNTTIYSSKGPNNLFNYSNPKMDQLLKNGLSEVDPEKRKTIYDEVQELLSEELPTLVLYYDKRMMAVSKRVKVGQPTSVGALVNVHEWDVK